MILTNCAACAAPLAHDAPRCIRCHTRYCNKTCQHDHWRRGHKQICKKIHRAGGAEQYYADKNYKEAVAVAVEACADDTKGQTCYICMEALHRRTGEGLVRGCACGDRDGVASGSTGVTVASCTCRWARIMGLQHPETPHLRAALVQARTKVAHARLLATGEATTSFEPVPGLDLEHVVIHGFPPGSAEATCCFLVFWSCAAVALAWLVFFYKY